jgi:hypothetical protein
MTAKTSGDSSPGVSGNIFVGIQHSFTTQGFEASYPWTRIYVLTGA